MANGALIIGLSIIRLITMPATDPSAFDIPDTESSSFESALRQQLQLRRDEHLYRYRKTLSSPQQARITVDGKTYLAFCSNDYLGLASHPELAIVMSKASKYWGTGAGASHLIVGHQQLHEELEQALAEHVGRPRALLFSSGYMANMGAIKALLGADDFTFHDALNHASLLDGAWLSRAKFQRFDHGNYDQLGQQLAIARQLAPHSRRLIVSDSVFSMDGEIADVRRLSQLSCEHDAWLMIDDAHGLGVLGTDGSGIASHSQLDSDQIQVLVGTLGKALGSFGAFVAGSDVLVETLIQRARSYIYTTALPAPVAAVGLKALEIVRREQWRRDKLSELIAHFRRGAARLGLPIMSSNTPVQPLLYKSAERTLAISAALAEQGILITAIRPPTVPKGASRLRITLSVDHSVEDIDFLLKALEKISIG